MARITKPRDHYVRDLLLRLKNAAEASKPQKERIAGSTEMRKFLLAIVYEAPYEVQPTIAKASIELDKAISKLAKSGESNKRPREESVEPSSKRSRRRRKHENLDSQHAPSVKFEPTPEELDEQSAIPTGSGGATPSYTTQSGKSKTAVGSGSERADLEHEDESTAEESADDDDFNDSDDSMTNRTEDPCDQPESPIALELDITRGAPPKELIEECLSTFRSGKTTTSSEYRMLHQVMADFSKLNPDGLQQNVIEFLNNRIARPSTSARPIVCDLRKPKEIVVAARGIITHNEDTKIHLAFTQMRLFHSVEIEVQELRMKDKKGRKSSKAFHLEILKNIASDIAGNVSETEHAKVENSCIELYKAGRNWMDIVTWFGGAGIVILFVMAGIGCSKAAKTWTDFQRDCVKRLASPLHVVKALVRNLGDDCLYEYCKKGFLDPSTVERIGNMKIYDADESYDSDTSSQHEGSDAEHEEDMNDTSYKNTRALVIRR